MSDFVKTGYNDTQYLCASALGMPVKAADQVVTIDATAGGNKNSAALTLGRVYSFTPTVDCYMAFGAGTVTVTAGSNYFVPAGQERIFVATQTYVAVIRAAVNGSLFISKLDGVNEG